MDANAFERAGVLAKEIAVQAATSEDLNGVMKSALKMIYMAISEASKRSTKALHNWKEALNHFAIMFEERMPKELA